MTVIHLNSTTVEPSAYCDGSTCYGHGEYAICGKPYYGGGKYQCQGCQLKDAQQALDDALGPVAGMPLQTADRRLTVTVRMTVDLNNDAIGTPCIKGALMALANDPDLGIGGNRIIDVTVKGDDNVERTVRASYAFTNLLNRT